MLCADERQLTCSRVERSGRQQWVGNVSSRSSDAVVQTTMHDARVCNLLCDSQCLVPMLTSLTPVDAINFSFGTPPTFDCKSRAAATSLKPAQITKSSKKIGRRGD